MTDQKDLSEDYDFEWHCSCCGHEPIKVKEDIEGECPKCQTKYRWDYDCQYEGAVYIPIFEF